MGVEILGGGMLEATSGVDDELEGGNEVKRGCSGEKRELTHQSHDGGDVDHIVDGPLDLPTMAAGVGREGELGEGGARGLVRGPVCGLTDLGLVGGGGEVRR